MRSPPRQLLSKRCGPMHALRSRPRTSSTVGSLGTMSFARRVTLSSIAMASAAIVASIVMSHSRRATPVPCVASASTRQTTWRPWIIAAGAGITQAPCVTVRRNYLSL